MTRAHAAAALWLALAAPASALVIHEDHGGSLSEYADRYAAIARRGEQIVVAGTCISACTLVLGLPHVCVTPGARFGFHRAYEPRDASGFTYGRDSPEGTAYLMAHYPPAVRAWLARHGGLTRNLKIMPGAASGLRRCSQEQDR
jgi:hypothetical protein